MYAQHPGFTPNMSWVQHCRCPRHTAKKKCRCKSKPADSDNRLDFRKAAKLHSYRQEA